MYSEKLKQIAIKLYYEKRSYRKVADMLDISKSIIHYWINYTYKPIKKKLNQNQLYKFIKNTIHSNSFTTVSKLTVSINKKFKLSVSRSFIYTFLKKRMKYSFKKVDFKKYYKNISQINKLQKKFRKLNRNYQNIICVDETYIHSNAVPYYGWCLKNKRLIKYSKCNPKKYSILMAISTKGVISYQVYNKNVDGKIFLDFIKKLVQKVNNSKILMDNVSFHKSKEIHDIIKKSSNQIWFIPPYSPELNPIEEVFSLLKNNIKKTNSKNSLLKINKCIYRIKYRNFENYYKHSFQKK